jgi:formate hydrogenlyase subunit 3/multisubunit Na+/H+ antiporter MnhD subunit
VFLLLTGALWLLAGVYARGYLRNDPREARFFAFFLLAMTGNLGLIVAQDMASFYALFALMTFSSYGLVVHSGSGEARRASVVYIVMAILGEAALFAGMIVLSSAADTTVFAAISFTSLPPAARQLATVLAFIGLAVKVGVFGLHMWLPLAHPAAPTPASAVLSGAMIKAGVIGWLRFLPLGEVDLPGAGSVVAALGLLAGFAAVLIGVTQNNPKTVLAYSSVSQMGLVTVALGFGMSSTTAWAAAEAALLIYVLHHGLAKGALFLGVGIADDPPRSAAGRALVRTGLVLPALALAGFPLTSGALAKTALKGAIGASPAAISDTVTALLPLAAVGTTVLMGRFLALVWRPRDDSHKVPASLGMRVSWLLAVALSAVVVWVWPSWLAARWSAKALAAGAQWGVAWPVLVGLALVAVAHAVPAPRAWLRTPLVPAGDLLQPMLKLGALVGAGASGVVARVRQAADRRCSKWPGLAARLESLTGWK